MKYRHVVVLRRLRGTTEMPEDVMTKPRLIEIIVLLLFLTWSFPCAAVEYPSEASGRLEIKVDLSDRPEKGETRLWLPYPLSDERQLVTDVKIQGDFSSSAVLSDAKFSTPMLFASWPEGASSKKLTFSFHVTRKEVSQRELPEREALHNSADFARYLGPTSLGPVDGAVKRLADEITKGKSGLLEKARAVYEWTCRSTFRDPETKGCGEGDVCELLKNPGGKCADIHSVFVAVARAAGVPAREVFGIRLGKEEGQDVTSWQHCWAEFYLPGYGWISVDPADVRKMMLKRDMSPMDPVPDDLFDYYWGGLDPFRVKLSVGRDLTLNPPQQGGVLNYLMYPYGEVGQKVLNWLDPAGFSYSITYREK